jgi:hypothetical protein
VPFPRQLLLYLKQIFILIVLYIIEIIINPTKLIINIRTRLIQSCKKPIADCLPVLKKRCYLLVGAHILAICGPLLEVVVLVVLLVHPTGTWLHRLKTRLPSLCISHLSGHTEIYISVN